MCERIFDDKDDDGFESYFTISGKKVKINTFFCISCLEQLYEFYEKTKDYRKSFASLCFSMYKDTLNQEEEIELTEEDFINASDAELCIIIDKILKEESSIKAEFDQLDMDDYFERFFLANGKSISKMLEPAIKSIKEMVSTVNTSLVTSILESIPKISLDFSKIIESIFEQFQQNQEEWQRLAKSLSQKIQSFFSEVDFSFLADQQEWKERNETLKNHGWFYINELPEETLSQLSEKKDSLTTEEIDGIICDFFRKDNCKALKQIINNWQSSPFFISRKRVFHEAIVNHSRKYYNTSITTITLHTEGVIIDFVRMKLKPETSALVAINKIIDLWGELPIKELALSDWRTCLEVMDIIVSSFSEHFSPDDPESASNNCRHKIAHGHLIDSETEANSLKRFLYLNELFKMLNILDKYDIKITEDKSIIAKNAANNEENG